MKWVKLGRIFNPTEHLLSNGCAQFAQSPQALVFDDFVRIYFSTRSVDKRRGKYLSHISYVDMDKKFKKIIYISEHTVVPLGGLGCFDEHGIFPINVLRHKNFIYGYTCGWSRRVSVSVETAIGLAISRDNGQTFDRISDGPILGASLKEPCLVGDGFVKIVDNKFHMWYIFGQGWRKHTPDASPDRIYKIGHATSMNGIEWTKEEARSIIPSRLGPDESQALPSVVQIGPRYHMMFCYRESFDFRTAKGRGYRLGHAWSDDLANWTRDDDSLALEGTTNEWDSDMQCYPNIFACDDNIYLLYNGNEFGRYGFGLAVMQP